MSLVDVDSWLNEHDSCVRLCQFISNQLAQRENRQKQSAEYNRFTNSIQLGLKQLANETQQLKKKLDSNAKEQTITFEEVERRQRQVEVLQSNLQQLQNKFTPASAGDAPNSFNSTAAAASSSAWQPRRSNFGNLPATHARSKIGKNPFDEDDEPLPSSRQQPAKGKNPFEEDEDDDVESLQQHRSNALEAQNRGLDVLSQTLARQRQLASQLGQEVDDQNVILDNLANNMERVDARVHNETSHIGQVTRQDKTCGYWIVILLLFVAIVIVAII